MGKNQTRYLDESEATGNTMQRYGENNDFQIGIDVANDVAENARDTEILLNDEIFEDFSNNINNNFCTFAPAH